LTERQKKTVFENREICSLIDHETIHTWNPAITSHSGAVGLMQEMPYHPVSDRTDPEQNIKFGIAYLSGECLIKAKGNKPMAFAKFHGGPNREFLRRVDQNYVIAILKRLS
jgi:soluble lytic murein transglycosylase-like protein